MNATMERQLTDYAAALGYQATRNVSLESHCSIIPGCRQIFQLYVHQHIVVC